MAFRLFIVLILLTLTGWAAPLGELESIEHSLRQGHPEHALQQLHGLTSTEAQILKAEALLEAKMYSQAASAIENLPPAGQLVAPWTSRVLLLRGRLARLHGSDREAARMFEDAERESSDPDAKVRALDLRLALWDSLDKHGISDEIAAKRLPPLVPQLTPHALAAHLLAQPSWWQR